MSTEFFDSFNAALPDLEASFQEYWTFNGNTYPAIAVDQSSINMKVMRGGQYVDANTHLFVREGVFLNSGVKEGSTISVRSQLFTVNTINRDGDDSRTLILSSPQLDIWK